MAHKSLIARWVMQIVASQAIVWEQTELGDYRPHERESVDYPDEIIGELHMFYHCNTKYSGSIYLKLKHEQTIYKLVIISVILVSQGMTLRAGHFRKIRVAVNNFRFISRIFRMLDSSHFVLDSCSRTLFSSDQGSRVARNFSILVKVLSPPTNHFTSRSARTWPNTTFQT